MQDLNSDTQGFSWESWKECYSTAKTDLNHGDLRIFVNYIHKHILGCLFSIAKKFEQTHPETLIKILSPWQMDHENLQFWWWTSLSSKCALWANDLGFTRGLFNRCRSLGPTWGLQNQNLHWNRIPGLKTTVVANVGMPRQWVCFPILYCS